jgi:hypothetical protein
VAGLGEILVEQGVLSPEQLQQVQERVGASGGSLAKTVVELRLATEADLVRALATTLGIVLLIMGRRVVGMPLAWLHYLYGSLFPFIAIIGGRLAAIRRETRAYVGLAWGAFFALALSLRAVQNACGDPLQEVLRCLTP